MKEGYTMKKIDIDIDELEKVSGGDRPSENGVIVTIDGQEVEIDLNNNEPMEIGIDIEGATTNPHSKNYKGGLIKKLR